MRGGFDYVLEGKCYMTASPNHSDSCNWRSEVCATAD